MLSIQQYTQHYNNTDYINKLAIFILDVNIILNKKYEDSIIPYISNDMKMEDWITDYLDKSSLRLRSNNIVSREYGYDIQVKKMNGEYFLNMKDIDDGKRINSFYSKESQVFLSSIDSFNQIEDCDIIQALKRIYVANLYIENQKVQKKYSELHKNLEFMKKFLRDCFTK